MRTEQIEISKALTKNYWTEQGLEYLWKQEISSVALIPVSEATDLEAEFLLEARIFTEEKEIHIFKYADGLRAVATKKEPGDEYFDETQILRKKYGCTLTIRNYIGYDEDGQAYVKRSVLNRYRKTGGGGEKNE